MNLGHHFPEPKVTSQVGTLICHLRQKAGLSAQELSESIGKRFDFVDNIEFGLEPLHLADFVEIAYALGHDPIEVLREIVSGLDSKST